MEDDHAAKPPEFTEQQARQFWAEARKKVQAGDCDFTGRHFPTDPDRVGFGNITFTEKPAFAGATFEGDTWFGGATFKGDTSFEGATFKGHARFGGATFGGNASFGGATFEGRALFDGATFEGNAWFNEATFEGDAAFGGATFKGLAAFGGATFEGHAQFYRATFEGRAWFDRATFERNAWFDVAEAGNVSFLYPWETPRPFRHPERGESAYRLAKRCAQRRGDYRRAGHYHYAEQCAIDSGNRKGACWRPWRRDFWQGRHSPLWAWGEFLVGRLLFGYGERPLRVLIAAVAVILCWAAVYWFGGVVAVTPEGRQIVTCHEFTASLYFSIVTFTTLGYGDLRPPPSLRLVAGAEAMLGAGLMALFIVSLARKFTR